MIMDKLADIDSGFMADKEMTELKDTLEYLTYYVRLRTYAQTCRINENIDRAIRHESHAQTIYDKLPQWAQW